MAVFGMIYDWVDWLLEQNPEVNQYNEPSLQPAMIKASFQIIPCLRGYPRKSKDKPQLGMVYDWVCLKTA